MKLWNDVTCFILGFVVDEIVVIFLLILYLSAVAAAVVNDHKQRV